MLKWQWSHLNEAAQTSGESFIILLRLALGQGTQTNSVSVYANSGSSASSHREPRSSKEGRAIAQQSSALCWSADSGTGSGTYHSILGTSVCLFLGSVRMCSKNHQEFIWTNNQEETINSRVLNFPSSGVNRKKFLIPNSLLIKWILFTHQESETTGRCLVWGKESPNEINSNSNGVSLIMWPYSYLLTESCWDFGFGSIRNGNWVLVSTTCMLI